MYVCWSVCMYSLYVLSVCTCICEYVSVDVCMYIRIHVRTHVNVCMYIPIYIRTQTYRQTPRRQHKLTAPSQPPSRVPSRGRLRVPPQLRLPLQLLPHNRTAKLVKHLARRLSARRSGAAAGLWMLPRPQAGCASASRHRLRCVLFPFLWTSGFVSYYAGVLL